MAGVDEIRVVCNGELDPADVAAAKVAKAAKEGNDAVAKTLVSLWQGTEDSIDALLKRDRYKKLYDLLLSGRLKVRILPRGGSVFVHGKAGVIYFTDGSTTAFVGSMNDSVSGLRDSYEILWEDEDPEATEWVRDEFEYFWNHPNAIDLPDAVVKHVGAIAKRTEYRSIAEAREAETGLVPPAAVLADRPVYKGGQILRAWQKRFVQTCVDDWKIYGKARFVIADDVGLGKTLSMAAAAIVLSILSDKPVLILAPATLTWQWQDETLERSLHRVGVVPQSSRHRHKLRLARHSEIGQESFGSTVSVVESDNFRGAAGEYDVGLAGANRRGAGPPYKSILLGKKI